jgi:lipopolysaccharide/colanic/teichoic acid biosynthesis glycosyltransferase
MYNLNGVAYADASSINSKTVLGGATKRTFDIIFSIASLISIFPLFLLIMIMIRLNSKGDIFYVHNRIGLKGQSFPCLKFRTMVVDADEQLRRLLKANQDARQEFALYQKLKEDPRVIPGIGAFLRTTSLDELPQLLNVLCGQMSIVGPRPVTREELAKYGTAIDDYLCARPGITGLWQVSGRNHLSFERRVEIDEAYIHEWSFFKDIRIILKTVYVMALRHGAY